MRDIWYINPVTYPEFFLGRTISVGDLGGALMLPHGSRAKPWWGTCVKAPRGPKDSILWNHLLLLKIYPQQPAMKLIHSVCVFFFFLKILPKFKFEVNLSKQLQASLTNEDLVYLQIIHHYVYYLKYTELKSNFEHQVLVPKLVYRLLNPSEYIYVT